MLGVGDGAEREEVAQDADGAVQHDPRGSGHSVDERRRHIFWGILPIVLGILPNIIGILPIMLGILHFF